MIRIKRRFCFVLFSFFVFGLFRAAPVHMEVPRLRVESELHLPACTTAHGNAGSLTVGARPGMEPETSWFLCQIHFRCPTRGTPREAFLFFFDVKGEKLAYV